MRRPDCPVCQDAVRRRVRLLHRALVLLLGAASIPAAHAGGNFTLTSANLHEGAPVGAAQVFNGGDCKGGNRSPQLSWRGAPAGTRNYAITLFDPDAPGPGWWHWAVARIPANVTQLPENASASGYLHRLGALEARNDFGTQGYAGPCPPPGKPHRYVLTVYALGRDDLRLSDGGAIPFFDHEISTTELGSARLVVIYGR